jgi:putative tricarboxylic transport membrane protein
MKQYDFVPGLFFLIIGIVIAVESIRLRLGNFGKIDVGLIPFLISILIISMSTLILLTTRSIRAGLIGFRDLFSGIDLRSIVLITIYLAGYAVLLEILGYIVVTFIFLGLSLKTISPMKYKTMIITTLLVTLVSYFIFILALDVQLPSGILGVN